MAFMQYDYLIVGSGLYGSVLSYLLGKSGKRVLVLEKRQEVGGNIRTEMRDGIPVHLYGAHIFHTRLKEVWDFVSRFVTFNSYINSPIASYKGELYNLPFNMNTFYGMWKVKTPAEAEKILARQRAEFASIAEPKNLEEQALKLVGRDIYEKLIKGYTEKQWGMDCTALPSEIIRRLPVRLRFDNNYFNDPYQGIPIEGYNTLISKLLSGIEVKTGVDFNENQAYWKAQAGKVIYTGPLDAYFHHDLGPLDFRSVRFETERLEMENYQGVAVVNYTDRETPYTRIIEHKHFVFGTGPVTWISREYSVDYKTTGEPYYPINNEKNMALYAQYAERAKADQSLLIGGRLAEYRYYDMDATIASALALYQRIATC